jgi:hypothetical protein
MKTINLSKSALSKARLRPHKFFSSPLLQTSAFTNYQPQTHPIPPKTPLPKIPPINTHAWITTYLSELDAIKGSLKVLCKAFFKNQYLDILVEKLFPKPKPTNPTPTAPLLPNLIVAYNLTNWLIKKTPLSSLENIKARELNYKISKTLYNIQIGSQNQQDIIFSLTSTPQLLKEKWFFRHFSGQNFAVEGLPFSNVLLVNNYLTLYGAGLDARFFCGSFDVYVSRAPSVKQSLFNFGLLLDSYYILLAKYYAGLKRDFLTGTA